MDNKLVTTIEVPGKVSPPFSMVVMNGERFPGSYISKTGTEREKESFLRGLVMIMMTVDIDMKCTALTSDMKLTYKPTLHS